MSIFLICAVIGLFFMAYLIKREISKAYHEIGYLRDGLSRFNQAFIKHHQETNAQWTKLIECENGLMKKLCEMLALQEEINRNLVMGSFGSAKKEKQRRSSQSNKAKQAWNNLSEEEREDRRRRQKEGVAAYISRKTATQQPDRKIINHERDAEQREDMSVITLIN